MHMLEDSTSFSNFTPMEQTYYPSSAMQMPLPNMTYGDLDVVSIMLYDSNGYANIADHVRSSLAYYLPSCSDTSLEAIVHDLISIAITKGWHESTMDKAIIDAGNRKVDSSAYTLLDARDEDIMSLLNWFADLQLCPPYTDEDNGEAYDEWMSNMYHVLVNISNEIWNIFILNSNLLQVLSMYPVLYMHNGDIIGQNVLSVLSIAGPFITVSISTTHP